MNLYLTCEALPVLLVMENHLSTAMAVMVPLDTKILVPEHKEDMVPLDTKILVPENKEDMVPLDTKILVPEHTGDGSTRHEDVGS